MTASAALSGILLALGFSQLAALLAREEPYPLAAALLALLLILGGAVLAAFVATNLRQRGARDAAPSPTPAAVLSAAALAALAAASLEVWRATGTFFPFRMALAWRGPLPFQRLAEAALPMMLAGSCLVALGALATAAAIGALWMLLYARRLDPWARGAGAALSFVGAIPYVAFALVVRALFCPEVAFLAAGRWLALRPDDQLAYRSLMGIAPGLLFASLALGLGIGRGLWSWLDDVR
ncbi:MAG TPA: hypothetical protein VMK66_15900, partial [Myxococcales bacterium]|nr:hypothetical protein [Myxococcales bacterium]